MPILVKPPSAYLKHEDSTWQAHIGQNKEDLTDIIEPIEELNEGDEGQARMNHS